MATLLTCPRCDASLKLPAEPAPGKRVKCPNCATVFTPGNGDARAVSAGRPPAPVQPPADADEDDLDREEHRPRPQLRGNNGLLIGLLVGGGTLALLLVCAGIGLVALSALYSGPVAQNSQVQPVDVQVNAGPNAAAGDNAPPGLYGDQGGEAVAPADPTLPDTLLRARAGDTFYKLTGARVGTDRFGRPTLFVDYDTVRNGQYNGATLIIHGDDGRRQTVILLGFLRTHGTMEINSMGFGFPGRDAFPKNFEVYLSRGDGRYGAPAPTFKVSNSLLVGAMTRRTRARNWTKEEIARLTKPPPNFTNPNAHPDVGKDTEFAGNTTGGAPMRYVEPKGLLLGLDYRLGEWGGEKCLATATAVFKRDQPVAPGMSRVLAKEGYAIGGLKVRSKKYVDAVQVVFFRVKADGKLDPADSYTSDWCGEAADQPLKTLAGDGTRVIGLVCRQGAILDGLALVVEKSGEGKP
jgi:hypothetical protein